MKNTKKIARRMHIENDTEIDGNCQLQYAFFSDLDENVLFYFNYMLHFLIESKFFMPNLNIFPPTMSKIRQTSDIKKLKLKLKFRLNSKNMKHKYISVKILCLSMSLNRLL